MLCCKCNLLIGQQKALYGFCLIINGVSLQIYPPVFNLIPGCCLKKQQFFNDFLNQKYIFRLSEKILF